MDEKHNGAGWFAEMMSNRPLIVGLLFLGTYFAPFLILFALPLAYVFRRDPEEEWEVSHFHFLIRTFWIAILILFLGFVLGFVTSFMMQGRVETEFVWVIALVLSGGFALALSGVRVVLSIMKSSTRKPIKNPKSWLI